MEYTRYNTKKCSNCGSVASLMVAALPEQQVVTFQGGVRWRVRVFRSESGATFYGGLQDPETPCLDCPGCDKRRLYAKPVRGRLNPGKKCNAKCLSGYGASCECSCGGKNHGAAYDHAG